MFYLQKQEVTGDVLKTMQALSEAGAVKKWSSALEGLPDRRNVMLGAHAAPCA